MSLTREQDEQISALYHEMFNCLLKTAVSSLRSEMLAEEAVQETFCIACRKPDDLLSSKNPQGWLVKTLRYVISNMKRLATTQDKLMAAVYWDYNKIVHFDDYSNVEYADMISPEEFLLFRRITVDRLSMREAAAELEISVEACKKRVQRIRAKLRRIVNNKQIDDVPIS